VGNYKGGLSVFGYHIGYGEGFSCAGGTKEHLVLYTPQEVVQKFLNSLGLVSRRL